MTHAIRPKKLVVATDSCVMPHVLSRTLRSLAGAAPSEGCQTDARCHEDHIAGTVETPLATSCGPEACACGLLRQNPTV